MDVYAVWVATHPLLIFLLLPAMSAAGALLVWQLVGGLPAGRRRTLFYGGTALAAVLLFALLAVAVHRQGGLVAFDVALSRQLGLSMEPALLWALSWFTYLGDRNFLIGIAAFMTLALLWNRQWVLAAGCAAATAGGGAFNWLFKHVFQRVRPDYQHTYSTADGWSFPSGHASAAMAVYGMACYLLLRALPARWRPFCLAAAAALIMAIGVSRVLLQVHYASDVVAGFAISSAWLALCVAATEQRLRRFRAE
ncbi:phosphatase PAP2 family protein [Bordetella sp. 2513F-2]